MKQVTLGRTGIISPKNAFGALPVQRVPTGPAELLLRRAYDVGFRFFDTARGYSDSEEKIGRALSDIRHNITIATKTMASNVTEFWQYLETSLTNLKTDYIDIYQFHSPAYCPRPGDDIGLYDAALEAKRQGKIRFIGFTNHRPNIAEEAVTSGLFDTLQFPFCYLASEKEIDLVRLCEKHNVGFIAMKALSGGLITKSDAAYAWLDQFDNVLPIWGIQRESELNEFAGYFDNPPTMDERITSIIEDDRRELIGDFCRACGYCAPCPMDIQIHMCTRMIQLIRRAPSANLLSDATRDMMLNIENCTGCGQCMSRCPYNLEIPALLKKNLADYKDILAGKVSV